MFFWKLNYLCFFFLFLLPLMFKLSCKKFLFFLWDHLLRCQADLGSSSLPPWSASCVNGAAEALTSVYTPPPETKSYSAAPADLEFVIVFLPRPLKC